MQKIFDEVSSLDERAYNEFYLTPDILMEHAANGMAEFILKKFTKKTKVLIVVGSGNNGADGIALARLLHKKCKVKLFYAKEPKSQMALLQQKRAQAIGVELTQKIKKYDVVVDAIVGTGFHGSFTNSIQEILTTLNNLKAYKIACDVPSGYLFKADITLTMGGLKKEMFLDKHKHFVGDIKVIDLGIAREIYETKSSWHLLDMKDLQLPHRVQQDTHKGTYGHLVVASGEHSGAALLCALAAQRFGSGLVSLVGKKVDTLPHSLMYTTKIPHNTTAIALGMGLGSDEENLHTTLYLNNDYPIVGDADVFGSSILHSLITRQNVVLTPHPKEFVRALKQLGLANISLQELQDKRFYYVELFTQTYPDVVLILKGANVIIAQNNKFFINLHGNASLAKGGSGDVLSGLVGALLAQGYSPLSAAINGSLTHTKLANNYKKNSFSLLPQELIEGLCDV